MRLACAAIEELFSATCEGCSPLAEELCGAVAQVDTLLIDGNVTREDLGHPPIEWCSSAPTAGQSAATARIRAAPTTHDG